MENPATWGPLEHAIDKAIRESEVAQAQGICGLSPVKCVADAVRKLIPQIEITSELSKPKRCRVWIDGILRFDGLDHSASVTIDDLTGIAPDWTGGKPPEQYVSEQRNRGNDND